MISYDAFFDELIKIGRPIGEMEDYLPDTPIKDNIITKQRVMNALKAALATGVGAGVGHFGGKYVLYKFPQLLSPTGNTRWAAPLAGAITGLGTELLIDLGKAHQKAREQAILHGNNPPQQEGTPESVRSV